MKISTSLNRLLIAVAFAGCSSLSASVVQFSTSGVFSTSGTAVGSFGGLTLTFAPILSSTVDATPFSFTSFGDLISSTSSATPITLPAGLTLTINIMQSSPTSLTGSLVGTLAGTISANASTAMFTPSSATLTLGTTTYAFQPGPQFLVPPTSGGGDTTIQGIVTTTASTNTPETGTFSMLCGGLLLAVGGSAKLRRYLHS